MNPIVFETFNALPMFVKFQTAVSRLDSRLTTALVTDSCDVVSHPKTELTHCLKPSFVVIWRYLMKNHFAHGYSFFTNANRTFVRVVNIFGFSSLAKEGYSQKLSETFEVPAMYAEAVLSLYTSRRETAIVTDSYDIVSHVQDHATAVQRACHSRDDPGPPNNYKMLNQERAIQAKPSPLMSRRTAVTHGLMVYLMNFSTTA